MAVVNKPIINKPDMNYGLWAENGNVEIPSSEKVELGWIAEKPLNEQMNWVQNRQDAMLQYINQHGIAEWDKVTTYPINAFVARQGVVYKALSQNVDKDPTLNTAIWNVAFSTYQDFDNLKQDVKKIKDIDGYVQHYVRKSAPILNAVARGFGYAGQDLSKGVFFDSNNNTYVRNGNNAQYNFNGTNTQENDVIRKGDLQAILEQYTRYKVGDLYLTLNQQNPATTLGYGSWVLYGKGKALVGLSEATDVNSPDWTKYVGGSYGRYEHTLTVSEMPSHNHQVTNVAKDDSGGGYFTNGSYNGTESDFLSVSYTGGGQPHNNVQPSVVVAIWRRVA